MEFLVDPQLLCYFDSVREEIVREFIELLFTTLGYFSQGLLELLLCVLYFRIVHGGFLAGLLLKGLYHSHQHGLE